MHRTPLQPEQESIFRTFSLGRLNMEVHLHCRLRVMTKKRSSTLLTKKVHPQTKSWLCLCPFEGIGATYGVNLRLIANLIVDFLFIIIELFF